MSFDYTRLNPALMNAACDIFGKPSTHWTEKEHKQAVVIIEAMRIVASYSTELTQMNNQEPWSAHVTRNAGDKDG